MTRSSGDAREARLPRRSLSVAPRNDGAGGAVALVLVHVLVIGLSAQAVADANSQSTINWSHDYHEGLEQAQNEQKPVLLDFYADWCGPCGMMDAQTYTDPGVVKVLNDFVCIKLNVDEQEKAAFAYRVQSIPRMIALNVHGEIVGDIVGFTDSDLFLFFLEDAQKNARKRIQGPIVSVPRAGGQRAAKPQPTISADTEMAALIELLSNLDPATREKAREECLHRNTPEVRDALVKALMDDYLGTRIAAWHTLRKMEEGLRGAYDPWATAAERTVAVEALRTP